MIKKLFPLVVLSFVLLLSSCNGRKKEEQQADKLLENIEQLIAANDYKSANSVIESLHKTYPRLVSRRKVAAAYADTIVRRESALVLIQCGQLLPPKTKQLDSLKVNFKLEKNEKYQETGNYVYKTQTTEQNAGRNYLKYSVDENGDTYLVSNYTGRKINHHSIKVSTGDLSQQTDSLQRNGVFHAFDDSGAHYETLTFRNADDNGLAAFISAHAGKPIKITLTGNNNYSYTLLPQDAKAIGATYQFASLLKETKQLQKDAEKATIRIEKIKLLYNH